MFKSLQKNLEKATKTVVKEVKKMSQTVKQRFSESTKDIIGDQYFPIIDTTEEGMFKTQMTEKLIVLSKLAYRLSKTNDINSAIKQDKHFIPYLQSCQLIVKDDSEGMNMIVDRQVKHIYFCFKGTSKGNTKDYMNDFYIFFKNNPDPKKWKAAQFVTEQLEKFVQNNPDHQDYIIILTGHSLGGAIAEGLTLEMHDIITHTESFNSGTTPLRKGRSKISAIYFGKKVLSRKIISHHMQYDPLSWGPVKGAIRDSIKCDKIMPHSIDNFLDIIFNFSQNIGKDDCQMCGKVTSQQEQELCQQMKTKLFCDLHFPGKCQVCAQLATESFKIIDIFNKKFGKKQQIRLHKDCWLCQFCGKDLYDTYQVVDGFIVHDNCQQQMQQALDQDEKELNNLQY